MLYNARYSGSQLLMVTAINIKKALFSFFVLSLATALCAQTTAAPKVRLTPEQALAQRRIRELQASPDGTRLVFTVSEPPKGPTPQGHIWILNGSGEIRQFTNSSKSENHPRWSPDGKTIAFLSDREEVHQIYLIPADGGEAIALTRGKQEIQNLEWSPDGKQIAFLAAEAKTDAEEKKEKDKDDAKSIDRDEKRTFLWVFEVQSRQVRKLLGAPWDLQELKWSPNGERILAIATDKPESDQETNRIISVNATDGKLQEIAAPRGPLEELRISPDGKWISYVGSRVDGPSPHDLYVHSVEASGTSRNLTATNIDRPIHAYMWRADGKLVALVDEGFRNRLLAIDPSSTATEQLLQAKMYASEFAVLSSGNVILTGENATHPEELWSWDKKSDPQSVSHFNQSFDQLGLSPAEFVHYDSFDGRKIEGMLLKPTGWDGKSKLPTVLLIHGGPTGNWGDHYDSWGQLLASAGYAVFYPNVRGSTGYGYDFMVLNRGDWGGGDFKDVMAGVDYLVARGVADPNRLGIAGWSYGGYMSEWAITQTQRFKAAVTGAGLSDLAAEYGTEEHPSYDEWFYGLPYEKPEGFRKSSPLTYIKNARTPTLILQGDSDTIDPLGQSQALYRALKRYGVETELVVYPRENHGFKEEKHMLDRLNRIVAWFDKYLK